MRERERKNGGILKAGNGDTSTGGRRRWSLSLLTLIFIDLLTWRSSARSRTSSLYRRNPCHASIVVVGESGSGKTTQIPQEPMVDILVFLTGQDDIEAAVQLINEQVHSISKRREVRSNMSELFVLPLHSGLSRAEQDLTNIAETSLTLEGIRDSLRG